MKWIQADEPPRRHGRSVERISRSPPAEGADSGQRHQPRQQALEHRLQARVRIGRAQSARFLVDPAICIPTSLAIRIATKSCPVMACAEANIWVAGELGTTSP